MTDGDAWEAHCAAQEGPPSICYDCGAAVPDDEAEEHRDQHWYEFLRSQCPIPPPPFEPRVFVLPDDPEEVPF
jgi:hypothetical protein